MAESAGMEPKVLSALADRYRTENRLRERLEDGIEAARRIEAAWAGIRTNLDGLRRFLEEGDSANAVGCARAARAGLEFVSWEAESWEEFIRTTTRAFDSLAYEALRDGDAT